MKAACELQWRPEASRMAVLVADAPAHGIGEYGDGFPNGGPDGEDPLLIARLMASQGISLVSFALLRPSFRADRLRLYSSSSPVNQHAAAINSPPTSSELSPSSLRPSSFPSPPLPSSRTSSSAQHWSRWTWID